MFFSRINYDPVDTATYAFFGQPQAIPRLSPVKCFFRDVKNVIIKFKLVHVALAVFHTDRPIDELYLRAPTVYSLIWFTICSIIQIPAVLTVLAFFFVTAGVISGLTIVHCLLFWRVIQGPQLQVYPPELPRGYNPKQRWIYINGIATGKTITRQNLQDLSELFHNPILAVNNRTYGFLGDLLECILQRAFGYRTKETGIALNIIREYLRDADIDNVILIAHSQGGIIASHIIDDLLCEATPDELAKMEVYTFGSAALKFNNPYKDKLRLDHVIPVMEHYCNEQDMVTSWGALASVDRQDLPFVGKVFISHAQTGHMLNQHYLRYMFTGPPRSWQPDNFQYRALREDDTDTYHVLPRPADLARGELSVQKLSKLWTYL